MQPIEIPEKKKNHAAQKRSRITPALRFKGFDGEWETKPLIELSENGFSNGAFNDPKKVGKGYRIINVQDMYIDGTINIDTLNRVNIDEKEFSKNRVEYGDIFFTRSSLVKAGIAYSNVNLNDADDLTFDGHLIRMRPKKEIHSPVFLYYNFATTKARQQFIKRGKTATMTTIGQEDIAKVEIVFPALPEQQKIASFLSAVDEKIQQLTRKKELLEQYKKGVMQQLFSGKLRFKDENGKAFAKWEEKRLGDVCEYKNGGSFENLVCEDGLYNLISLNSIDINGKLKSDHKKVSENDNSLLKDDLVMVLSDVAHGYFLGLTDVIPADNYVLNQRMGALKPKVDIDRYFLKTIINTNQRYFKLMGQGSSQKNLSKDDVLNFTFQQPAIEEQKKIANYLSNIDNKIENAAKQISETQIFKKGLLQQMFV